MSRRWLEVRARHRAVADLSPLLVEGLLALGGRAAEESEGWYVTAIEAPDDVDAFRARATRLLQDIVGVGDIDVELRWRSHEDWAETWKRGLAPRWVTERVLVRPSWTSPPDEVPQVEVVLDPGMAFGTAEHGTTRGCIRLLDGVVHAGDRVLDVGSGSGILAIVAARLGAAEVVAIEADALACEALRENLARNAVEDRVRCLERMVAAEDLAALGPVSGVVANIESGPLRRLMEGFAGALRAGGWLILSGILAGEWADVRAAAEAKAFVLREVDADGEWRSGLFSLVGR